MPFIQDIPEDADADADPGTLLNITRAFPKEDDGGGGEREERVAEASAGGGFVINTTSDVISIIASVASVIV